MTQLPARSSAPGKSACEAGGPRTVRVDLGPRSYDILIGQGLLGEAGRLLPSRFGEACYAVVTDGNVKQALDLNQLEQSLRSQHRWRGMIVVEPGEASKSFGALASLCERLLRLGVERNDIVIALGGGVIGDLAGFGAAILRRGVRYVQIPTTLLAQVDSSVGGKTGINASEGKNLIGAFHQPSLVLADTDLLTRLPAREMRAGYAEVVKCGLLGDAGFFAWLEVNAPAVLAREPAALAHAIARCVEMKAAIVARDETETGERMLLNLGHTFGHALEAWTGFSDRLRHGEGVAAGTCLALRLSEQLGLCPAGTAARVAVHLKSAGLPTRIADIPGDKPASAGELMRLMAQDKKVRRGQLTLILARDIGSAFVSRDVTLEQIHAFLVSEIEA